MKKKNDLNILKFPSSGSQLDRQIEAILFASGEPVLEDFVKDVFGAKQALSNKEIKEHRENDPSHKKFNMK